MKNSVGHCYTNRLGGGGQRSKLGRSTARVILGQVPGIATCGTRTHREVTASDEMPNLLTTRPPRTLGGGVCVWWIILL